MAWLTKDRRATAAVRDLGRAMRRVRQTRGYTQRDLEAASGADQTVISRLETGAWAANSIRWLALAMAALDAEPTCRPRGDDPPDDDRPDLGDHLWPADGAAAVEDDRSTPGQLPTQRRS